MGLLDAGAEEPQSKSLRYVVSAVTLILLLGASMWYFLRYTPEKHTVEHFLHAVVVGDSQQAYQIWKPSPSYSFNDFVEDWGPNGYYGPVKSFHIENRPEHRAGGSGVAIKIELSPYQPFPADDDQVKRSKTKEVTLWVEFKDQSITFPPE